MSEHADIKKQRVRDDFSNAAASYDTAAVLQREVCERTLERVDMLKLQPRRVLDAGNRNRPQPEGPCHAFSQQFDSRL